MDEQFKDLCARCRKRDACNVPCAFVEKILKEGNAGIFEKIDRKANAVMVYPANKKEVRESTMRAAARDKVGQQKIDAIFSTKSDNPFAHYDPKLRQTSVFIYKVLLGFNYQEIADIFEVTPENIRKIFHKAKRRILKALELCDQNQTRLDKIEHILSVNQEATGRLPKYQKWFLMNKLLGMSSSEIAEFDGTTSATVAAKIRVCADRLVTGNLTFLDPTDDDIKAAQERIEKKRQRDRKKPAKAA